MKRSKNVTDRVLLKKIYDLYYEEFCNLQDASSEGAIHIPIDCELVAKKLGLSAQLVFCRLYYHLDKKHRYQQSNDAWVHLFGLVVGKQRHCINFPLLSAVLAELEQSYYRFTVPIFISLFALTVSVCGFVASNT